MQYLVENGADINSIDINGANALFWMVYLNNFEMLKYLAEHGGQLSQNGKIFTGVFDDSYVGNELCAAAKNGNIEVFSYLMSTFNLAADKPENAVGWTPIHYAIYNNDIEMINHLIQYDKVRTQFYSLKDALLHFMSLYTHDPLIIKNVISAELDISVLTGKQNTALFSCIDNNNLQLFKYLVFMGLELSTIDEYGQSVYEYVLKSKKQGFIDFIDDCRFYPYDFYNFRMYDELHCIKKNDEIAKIDPVDGQTIIHKAILSNDTAIFQYLLKEYEIVSIKNKNEQTPLLFSLLLGNLEMAADLIEAGSDIKAKDVFQDSPLNVIHRRGYNIVGVELDSVRQFDPNANNNVQPVFPIGFKWYGVSDISPYNKFIIHTSGSRLCYTDLKNEIFLKSVELPSGIGKVTSIDVSLNGDFILVSTYFGRVFLLDFYTGRVLREYNVNEYYSFGGIAPDLSSIFVVAGGKCVLWDFLSGDVRLKFNSNCSKLNGGEESHLQEVKTSCFMPSYSSNSQLVAFGNVSGDINVFDINKKSIEVINAHNQDVKSVSFHSDNTHLLSFATSYGIKNTLDPELKVWDLQRNKEVLCFSDAVESIEYGLFSAYDSLVVIVSDCIELYNFYTGDARKYEFQIQDKIMNATNLDDGSILFCTSDDFMKFYPNVNALSYSKNVCTDGTTELKKGEELGSAYLSLYSGNLVKIDLSTCEVIPIRSTVNSYCYYPYFSVSASNSFNKYVTGDYNTNVYVWNKNNSDYVKLPGHKNNISAAKFDFNDSLLVTAEGLGNDRSGFDIKIWNVLNNSELKTINAHDKEISEIGFISNSNLIYSCSRDNTVKIWDKTTGDLFSTFHMHEGPVLSLVQVSDSLLLTGDRTGDYYLWNYFSPSNSIELNISAGYCASLAFLDSCLFIGSGKDIYKYSFANNDVIEKG